MWGFPASDREAGVRRARELPEAGVRLLREFREFHE
jgi:hypothetical protein